MKTENILDAEGYVKNAENKKEAKEILKKFQEAGLMKFLAHDYRKVHALDFTEWFMNANMVRDQIRFSVQSTNVVVTMGDIRAAYELVALEDALPDLSQYAYNQQAFWEKVKLDDAPTNVEFTFKKNLLKEKFAKVMDLTIKIIVNRVAGMDSIYENMFAILHAIWNGQKCNWA